MRVKVIRDTSASNFERKINEFITAISNENGFASVKIQYSTCSDEYIVTYSAMIIY